MAFCLLNFPPLHFSGVHGFLLKLCLFKARGKQHCCSPLSERRDPQMVTKFRNSCGLCAGLQGIRFFPSEAKRVLRFEAAWIRIGKPDYRQPQWPQSGPQLTWESKMRTV
jgi:hypothetical protein